MKNKISIQEPSQRGITFTVAAADDIYDPGNSINFNTKSSTSTSCLVLHPLHCSSTSLNIHGINTWLPANIKYPGVDTKNIPRAITFPGDRNLYRLKMAEQLKVRTGIVIN